MKEILDNFHRYNSPNSAQNIFGLDPETEYDALVIAPSFTPQKLFGALDCRITVCREATYTGGYLLEMDGFRIAWVKIASSASNCIDHMTVCAELKFRRLIFTGAVGGLKADISLGDVCTPSYCISGVYANTYLKHSIQDFVPFERVEPDTAYISKVLAHLSEKDMRVRPASVFCTDSIALEYTHLAEIKEFQTDLIEMETSTFYLMANLMEVPAIALLVVSDNSATGTALVGRTEEEMHWYNKVRTEVLPEMILEICRI